MYKSSASGGPDRQEVLASLIIRALSQSGCRDAARSHLAATGADDVRGSRLRNLSFRRRWCTVEYRHGTWAAADHHAAGKLAMAGHWKLRSLPHGWELLSAARASYVKGGFSLPRGHERPGAIRKHGMTLSVRPCWEDERFSRATAPGPEKGF